MSNVAKDTYHLPFTIYYLLLLLPNLAFSSDNQLEIGSIKTAGNLSITGTAILSSVRSKVGERFDAETAAEDCKRINKRSGIEYSYYNTEVVDGKIQLTFVVVERDIIRSIEFVGNRRFKAKSLRKKTGLRVGDYLDAILIESGRSTIAEFYRKKGYAFSEVSVDSEQLRKGKVVYTIKEGPRVKIKAVKFKGNKALKTGALKKTIKTKKRKWLILQQYYIEGSIDRDADKLLDIYYDRGFLDVDVTAKRKFSNNRRNVNIIFEIAEGQEYFVENIIITGNEHFDKEQMLAGLKLAEGQKYNERAVKSSTRQILKLYRENGFVDVRAENSRKFVSENRVNVEFAIAEGERFRIGRVNITGNEQTQDKVVRRVLDEYDFAPGRWYNAEIARGDGRGELEKRVRQMVVAESATITPSGEQVGQRDAQVSIVEGQTGKVMLGAGITSDSGVIGQFVFEQRNFDLSNKPKSFKEFITGRAFKGAGQTLRIAAEPGTELSQYSISFTEPYFRNKPISLDVTGSSYARLQESYEEERIKGYFGFEKRYKNRWRRSIGFRAEKVNIGSIDADAPSEVKDDKGDNSIMGVKFGIGRDFTDDMFNPSKGHHFKASYEQLVGDQVFGILSGTGSWYRTLREDLAERKTILATKLYAATIIGNAPIFEKFYAGGQTTIRGFDYRGVSTRAGPDDDPIGSNWLVLAGAEIIKPLGDTLSVLFFVDSGMIDSGGYRVSAGTGIQIMIPQWLGRVPMRFEIATPIMKDGNDETQVFSFSVGRLF